MSGGGAATVWAPDAVQSMDLDFVLEFRGRGDGSEVLTDLGFHAESRYTLDFPPGPLTIGSELISNWDTLREAGLLLHIITRTDSCCDRLAGFLFWNDRGALEQALAVARVHRGDIDFERIEAWCRAEGKTDRYAEFHERL